METSRVTATTKVFHIELLETVTLFGYPDLSQAQDYPMIPAAQWAISHTGNDNVKQALTRYIQTTSYAIADSISKGNEFYFRVHHDIDIDLGGAQPRFAKDDFSDKEVDNDGGIDNVSWNNGVAARTKPDLTRMLGYTMYHTPVEVLGQQLLTDYTTAYGKAVGVSPASSMTYGRLSASNYAYTYVGPNVTQLCGGAYYMDPSYYNQAMYYKNVWTYTTRTCNDCADYISQALRVGNFPTDTIWNFTANGSDGHPGTNAWKVSGYGSNPQELFYWLDNSWGATTQYANASSLQLADLATTGYYWDGVRNHGAGHIVMITSIGGGGPYFSGHTNDRKGAVLSSYPSLAYYWHIYDNLFH